MFAYCNNNPVRFADFSGNVSMSAYDSPAAWLGAQLGEWIGNLLWDAHDKKLNEARRTPYHSNGTDNGAQIPESHTIKDPVIMYEYIEENRGDEVAGSTTGIVFEWVTHNIAYEAGEFISAIGFADVGYELKEKGRTLDIGRTIYDDSHGILSWAMWGGYVALSPAASMYDLCVKVFE